MNAEKDTKRLFREGLNYACTVLPLVQNVHLESQLKAIFPTVRRSKVLPLDSDHDPKAVGKIIISNFR
jgi:hypothetical protein